MALHHEQEIWNMGGLRKKMPVTFWTFLAGTVALAGVWPFSGFFSKDSILAQALEYPTPLIRYGLFAVGVAVTVLTAFYMFRLLFVAFLGAPRADAAAHAHESPSVLLWPLRLLAVFSIIGGLIGIEPLYGKQFSPGQFEPSAGFLRELFGPFVHTPIAAASGSLAVLIGLIGAYALYAKAIKDPLPEKLGSLSRTLRNRFYLDEIYEATVIRFHESLASIAGLFERWIIDGLCIGFIRGGTDLLGRTLRQLQTGNLQTYAFLFALGVSLVLYLALKWGPAK
jgi:NADH-quinone oxidoreductase subunit L